VPEDPSFASFLTGFRPFTKNFGSKQIGQQ
jgi:hypothetical protein